MPSKNTRAAAASSAFAAPSIIKGAGDIRVINLSNPRTGEKLRSVYWVEGEYIPEVMAEIDHIMRDWRTDQKHRIAPAVVDIMSAAHQSPNRYGPVPPKRARACAHSSRMRVTLELTLTPSGTVVK